MLPSDTPTLGAVRERGSVACLSQSGFDQDFSKPNRFTYTHSSYHSIARVYLVPLKFFLPSVHIDVHWRAAIAIVMTLLMVVSRQSWLYVLGQKRADSYVLLEHSVKKAVHFGLPVRLIFLCDC